MHAKKRPMPFENHFRERELPENASREEKASVKAAVILMRIVEHYWEEKLSRCSEALIQVEGSCIEDLRMRTHGLSTEQKNELKFRTGITPGPMLRAERTA